MVRCSKGLSLFHKILEARLVMLISPKILRLRYCTVARLFRSCYWLGLLATFWKRTGKTRSPSRVRRTSTCTGPGAGTQLVHSIFVPSSWSPARPKCSTSRSLRYVTYWDLASRGDTSAILLIATPSVFLSASSINQNVTAESRTHIGLLVHRCFIDSLDWLVVL